MHQEQTRETRWHFSISFPNSPLNVCLVLGEHQAHFEAVKTCLHHFYVPSQKLTVFICVQSPMDQSISTIFFASLPNWLVVSDLVWGQPQACFKLIGIISCGVAETGFSN